MSLGELISAVISLVLTLMIFSYIWKDNVLFRLALYLFIGVAAGYVSALAINNVILPQMINPLFQIFGGSLLEVLLLAVPPLVLGVLLFTKLSSRYSWLGNPTMAFLVGVGAAAAIGGSVLGTLFPQVQASINLVSLESAIILIGTLLTLFYFQFTIRAEGSGERNRIMEALGWGGQIFIAISFGVIFAGVYAAALTAFIERILFLVNFFDSLI